MARSAETTCADAVINQLHHGGVKVCFANPGTTEMWLVSSLEKQRGIRSILGLHEAVCTGACDGYARIARAPAMALLHLGPGLGNGLCNLHNARRAGSPVVVLVGDMATWHRAADPPLNQDIEALAATVSGAVLAVTSPETVHTTVQAALAATRPPSATAAPALTAPGGSSAAAGSNSSSIGNRSCCPGSKVATVIFPHDITWTPAAADAAAAASEVPAGSSAAATGAKLATATAQLFITPNSKSSNGQANLRLADSPAACKFMAGCAAALQQAPRGRAAVLLGGAALLSEGGLLAAAGRIAASLGAALLCEPLPGRIDRGAGLPHATRIPYFPQEASEELRKYEVLLLVDVRRPVAGFGYKDGPSQLLQQSDDAIWEIDASWGVAEALELLQSHLPGAADIKPGVNCRGMFAAPHTPALPTGPLTAAAMCQAVAALQPPGTILVDESLTSGTAYWEASKGCPPFSHLCLTGGAIGSGPPLATGAAVAAGPSRQVINLQADGSAMYTLQALWTQAREQLQVLTVICANNSYTILKVEAMRQRTTGSNALTSLTGPEIDWVALATGMGVSAGRADTAEQFAELMDKGLNTKGPFLIHADLRCLNARGDFV